MTISARDYLLGLVSQPTFNPSVETSVLKGALILAKKRLKNIASRIGKNARFAGMENRKIDRLANSPELTNSAHHRARLIREQLVPLYKTYESCLTRIERDLAARAAMSPHAIRESVQVEVSPVIRESVQVEVSPVVEPVRSAEASPASPVTAPAARVSKTQRWKQIVSAAWDGLTSFFRRLSAGVQWAFSKVLPGFSI